MKKIVTQKDFDKLEQRLEEVDDTTDILQDVHLGVIGGDVSDLQTSNEIIIDDVELQCGESGLAESISINTVGRVDFEGDETRFDTPYIDDLQTIVAVGTRLKQWFDALPDAK